MSNTPSNAEAWDLWLESITGGHHPASLAKFARAVLAKWGTPQPVNLGFTIENRAGIDVLVWKDGGCQPATSAEVAMWKALAAVQQPVVRDPQPVECTCSAADMPFGRCCKAQPMPDLTQLTERGAVAWAGVDAQALRVGRDPLTDAQIAEMMRDTWGCASIAPRHALQFARAIERAHGITQKGCD